MASSAPSFDPSLYQVYSAFRHQLSSFTHENQRRIKAAGMTSQQFSLLVNLGAAGRDGLSIGEAAQRLHIAHNSVVELSQRAETAGLLTRISPGGRRQGTLLLPTAYGLGRLNEITALLVSDMAESRLTLIEALTHWNTVLAERGWTTPEPLAEVSAQRAEHPDKPLVWRLLQFHLAELSVPLCGELDDSGEYAYPTFGRYWENTADAAYVFRIGGRPAGFALVRSVDHPATGHVLEEFCVLRAYRRQGAGAVLAGEVLRSHPGPWSVPYLRQDPSTARFWSRMLPQHAAQPPEHREDPARPGFWQYGFELAGAVP